MAGINYVNLFGAPAQQAPQAPVIPVQRIAAQAPMTPAAGALQGLSSAAGSIIAALSGNRKDRANQAVMDALMQSQKGWTPPDDIYPGSHRTPEQIAADPQTQAMLSGVPAALAQASGQPQQITADPGQQMAMAQGQPGVPQSAPITPVQVQPLTGSSGADTLVPSPNALAEDPEGTMGRFRQNMAAFETRDIGKMNPLQESRPGQMVAQAMSENAPRARTSYLQTPINRGEPVARAGETAPGTQGVPAALANLRYTAQQNPELASYLQGPMQNMQLMQMQQQEDARLREQALQDKWREPTSAQKNLRAAGIDPNSPEGRKALMNAGSTNVNVGVNNDLAKKEVGRDDTAVQGALDDARSAATTAATANELLPYIDKIYSGPNAEFSLEAVAQLRQIMPTSMMERLGIDDKVSDTQFAQTIMSRMVSSMIKQMGANPSNADLIFAQVLGPRLSNTPEGNRLIVDYINRASERAQERLRFIRDWRKQNGTFDLDGEIAWSERTASKPLLSQEQYDRARELAGQAPTVRQQPPSAPLDPNAPPPPPTGMGGRVGPGADLQQPEQPKPPPAVGTVKDGYEFLGGDPADSANWRKVVR